MLKENIERSESPATGEDVSMVGGGGGGSSESSTGVCAACCRCIEDRFYLLAVDRQWHLACLRCHQCKLPLHTQRTCYFRHGNIYCKEDYYRLFGIKRCARCQNGIPSRELVMRARDDVYHIQCFTCALCGVRLLKGDHFGVRNGLIYCRPHYEGVGHRGGDFFGAAAVKFEPLSPASVFSWNNGHHHHHHNNNNNHHHHHHHHHVTDALTVKGRPRKRKPGYVSDDGVVADLTTMKIPGGVLAGSPPGLTSLSLNGSLCVEMLHSSDLSSSMESLAYDSSSTTSPNSIHPGTQTHPQQRTKRMRTSFKHHQLRTMKSYFNVNQNPDAKDLKQLAQKTGLSKRVLQVWFQNARAKWRRNLMRQDMQTNANGITILAAAAGGGGGPASAEPKPASGNSLISDSSGGVVVDMVVDEFGHGRQQHANASSHPTLHFEKLY